MSPGELETLLERGFNLVPIEAGGKEPRWDLFCGPRPAERKAEIAKLAIHPLSAEDLRSWLGADPFLNFAAILGSSSKGVVVLDVDAPEALSGVSLPPTWTIVTQRGFHLYYRCSSQVKTLRFGWGDLLGEGQLVNLPGCSHPRGPRYRVLDLPGLTLKGPAPLDNDLLASLAELPPSARLRFPRGSLVSELEKAAASQRWQVETASPEPSL